VPHIGSVVERGLQCRMGEKIKKGNRLCTQQYKQVKA
jgi:hypothetical protein